jgi:hypothetical protein
MDTNEIQTVTVYVPPVPPVPSTEFPGSHVKLDYNWVVHWGGKEYGIWQMRGEDVCTLTVGDQMTAIPMAAPTFIAVTTSLFLAIGFVLVIGAKLLRQARKQI